ncbi:Transmembrane protein, partial [Galemys pyrenaicus]
CIEISTLVLTRVLHMLLTRHTVPGPERLVAGDHRARKALRCCSGKTYTMDQRKNESIVPSFTQLEDFLTEHDSNVVWLLVATILSCGWIIYLTYYNSRNVGLILTLVLNRLHKRGYIHIGSFSFSVLSGKVMVREIYYITEDMSIRIQDGFIIFRWWKMYNPKQKQHDPKAETRLYVTVNDFEFHVYNRSDLYGRLQELFGLEPTIVPPRKEEDKTQGAGGARTQSKIERVKVKTESQDPTSSWRSLIPVVKVSVSTGRLAFGNHYQPQTLCVSFDDAFLTYTTKPPSSHLDQFMHIVKGKLENVRVMLVPSPRYVGLQNDEPPRLMGEGFVVMHSNDVDVYYYMDEPGLVPEEVEENIDGETSSEDCKLQDLPPCWGLDIVCGKGTDFNYGPWADRQRDCLWKFFFPPDYQVLKVSEIAQPGRPRQVLAFELRMNIIADATVDLLFTKNRFLVTTESKGECVVMISVSRQLSSMQETNAVHVNVGAGSYLEINIPVTVEEGGYTPAIKGQLLHVDATTSMQYRALLEAEMLAFHINASYPRVWNMPQTWQCELEVYKATYHFIFAQKHFFTVYLAACGETLTLDFSLPFTDFVPATCSTRFSLRGEEVDLHLFLPDCHPSKYSLFMLVKNCHPHRVAPDSGVAAECQSGQSGQKAAKPKAGWVECWTVPSVVLTIDYTWHPIYPQKADEQLKQSLSEMEETLLSVLRPAQRAPGRAAPPPSAPRPPVDPAELPPDRLHVEMALSPDSQMTLYGPLLNAFLCIKENYFGEDDVYMDFEEAASSPVVSLSTSSSSGWMAAGAENGRQESESPARSPHPLSLRPWDITVLVNLYKVHGRLPVHGTADGPECPTAFLERLCFEMKKGLCETMLQLVLSPLNVFVSDNYQVATVPRMALGTASGPRPLGLAGCARVVLPCLTAVFPQRPPADESLREGHISLSGLQLRAHAMFSAEGLPLGSDSLEYAWLIDVQAGSLTAKVTAPQVWPPHWPAPVMDPAADGSPARLSSQLASLLEWGQTFAFHVVCREYELERPKSVVLCQHGVDRRFCESKLSCVPGPCPASEELKYTMTRVALAGADLHVVEQGCATNLKMGAVRVANCNLHSPTVGEGVSAAVQDLHVRQFVEQPSSPRAGLQPAVLRRACWLEAGSASLGLVTVDVALAADHPSKHEAQRHFLETHDARTKRDALPSHTPRCLSLCRLWFLWPEDNLTSRRCRSKCGCLGGCRFFGGTAGGLDFFRLEELTPSSSSAFSSTSAESDMCYGQSLLQPGERVVTRGVLTMADSTVARARVPRPGWRGMDGAKGKEWESKAVGAEAERRAQPLSLQVPLRPHSASSSSEESGSSGAAQPLLAGETESPASTSGAEDRVAPRGFLPPVKRDEGPASAPADVSGSSPVSPHAQERPAGQSPLRSPLKRQASVCSARLGSTKSLTAAFYGDKQPAAVGVQFSSDVSRSDENVLDSPKQRRSFGSFPYTPSADSSSFHQYRSMDSSMSMADSEAYFSAAEEFEPVSSDEGPGTYPGRKRKRRQAQQVDYSRGSVYHSVEGPLTGHGESVLDGRTLPFRAHPSQASFVSALGGEDDPAEHLHMAEAERAEAERAEAEQAPPPQPARSCYQTYLSQFQVVNWAARHPANKRTSKSSLHRPLDLDTPTSEDSSSSCEQLSVPTFKVVKQGLTANALLDRGLRLSGPTPTTPYTPLEKKAGDDTEDEPLVGECGPGQPAAQARTAAVVEVRGAVDVVLTPLVAEALDRYIEALAHCASARHPAAIVDDLHARVLREVLQSSRPTFSEQLSSKQDVRGTKTEHPPTLGTTTHGQAQTPLTRKQDGVTVRGLQASVSIPKVNLCLLQASVEEPPGAAPGRAVAHVSLVALCFDRITTQVRMNRGVVEEASTGTEPVRTSEFGGYVHATKMQPQSSGSLRSNAGAEKGQEIAAKLNIHRVHGQLRGLDTTGTGTCAITAIPFEKSKVLFTLEELDEFTFVDETDQQALPDVTRIGPSQEKWGWIMFECGLENLTIKGGRQSGAVLYDALGVMGQANVAERGGTPTPNDSSDSPTGSGYNTDVSEDALPCGRASPSSDLNGNSASDEQDEGVESDDLKKDLPLMPPPPDSCSMKLAIRELWFSFAAPTNVRSPAHTFSRQLNLLSTATPAVGAWLVPVDQLTSSLRRLETEGTLRVCAVMGCIMTEALENKSVHFPLRSKYNRLTKVARALQENPSCLLCGILHHYLHQARHSVIEDATTSDGLPALVTLKKGLVALARQWMKFIVVTPAFKGVSLHRPAQPLKPHPSGDQEPEDGLGLDSGGGLQSDTSADGAEFEFDAATVSEHTMLLEGPAGRPPPGSSAPVTGAELMRKLSKTHTHSDSALRIKGSHPYHSLSYTSGETATDSPAHGGRAGAPARESPRKESLLSYLTGSFPSLHNLLEGTPQRGGTAGRSGSLTRTGTTLATDMLSEHPLLSEPSSVSFYNWMSNAVGGRAGAAQESPIPRPGHGSLPTGVAPNLPTIPSASDFNTVLSSDQNTLDGTQSQHSTSQDDVAGVEEAHPGFPAVQLADAQVVFRPLLSHTGVQAQDAAPLCCRMHFGEHLSFSGALDRLRADIVDSDTAKERRGRRARRPGHVNLPPLEFKPALMLETFSLSAVVMEKSVCTPRPPAHALSFHDLSKRHHSTLHCDFTVSCRSISQHVDMALVRLVHQFSTMVDGIKATQTDIKLSRYTAGSASPTPTFRTRKHRDFRSSDFSRSSRGSLNGGNRAGNAKGKRAPAEGGRKEPRGKNSLGRSERRTSKVSRKGSKDVVDHTAIHMDDSDSVTVSEQSEPSAECWQNMYKLLNFYSLISDPTGVLEASSEAFGPAGNGRRPSCFRAASQCPQSCRPRHPGCGQRVRKAGQCRESRPGRPRGPPALRGSRPGSGRPLGWRWAGLRLALRPSRRVPGVRSPAEPPCRVVFEDEQDDGSLARAQRKRSVAAAAEPQHVTLIVFGIGTVTRTHLEADIGGLTMESELKRIHGSFTLKERMKEDDRDLRHRAHRECLPGPGCPTRGSSPSRVLPRRAPPREGLREATPFLETVVKCSVAKSQALYSAQRGLRTSNAAVAKLGAVSVSIPQHPATLHGMMVRSSHQLSQQISDLLRPPSAAPPPAKEDIATPLPSEKTPTSINQTPIETNEFPQLPEGLEKKPIVLKFSAMLDGIAIGAALLPSLKAEYKMGRMRSHGVTGAQTRFTFELPNHRLRFTSKVSATDLSTIPPSASLTLPPVTMSGKYVMEEPDGASDPAWSLDELPPKQGHYLRGNYLRCVAEVRLRALAPSRSPPLLRPRPSFLSLQATPRLTKGWESEALGRLRTPSPDGTFTARLRLQVGSFEHNLTTDLLNHLVFVQKVFMKEVNEVIQKVSGGEQPIPLWNEPDGTADGEKPKILLYSLNLQFKGIQVTATTPSMRAVRLETGLIELELSNRLQTKASPGSSSCLKLFGKCQVDLNLALGQIVKHQVYEEAGSDFHQVAYFKTRIGLRNALREEISGSSDREAVLITLNRPIVYAQPVAFDRAVLFWLNYKAAYDNWNEQRMALHRDIHVATKEVVDMLPGIQQTSAQALGTLFLQLTVNDLGICLPISSAAQSTHPGDLDTGSALVLTIESTLITACSSESLVSKGHFKNFCIRFADGFETSWDDWKPEVRGDLVMNACVVPDGTYEVCSRTAGQAAAESSSAGTWTLNVLWKMCGIDVHMDPNIGKRLSALGNTLTTLTGEEDADDIADLTSVNMADLSDEDEVDAASPTAHMEAADYRRPGAPGSQAGELRGRKAVKRVVDIRELNEQAKVIDDLKKLGASEGTINQEIQRYQQLESVAANDIRRDVRKKLRRSSMRAASLKDKWGLSYKPSYSRSKSISASGRPPLKRMERTSSRLGEAEELPEIRVDAASPGPRVTFSIQDTVRVPRHVVLAAAEAPKVRCQGRAAPHCCSAGACSGLKKTVWGSTPQPSVPGEGCFQFPEETELDLLSVTVDGPPYYSSHSEGSCSVFSSPKTPGGLSPGLTFQSEEGRRDDSLSSSSEDSEKDEDHERGRLCVYRRPLHATRKKATGFAAVHQLFTERWPTAPVGRSLGGAATERNIDFELDIRVEIDSGKCVLHPSTLLQEHDDMGLRRSCDRSSRSLDQDSPSKKKKFHANYASTTHLMAGKKVPSSLQTKPGDQETTVFYIPGVDVKLHYNSKTLKTESPNASRGSSLPRTLSKESKLYAKGKGGAGVKTAKLYAWVALQSLPEEMVISPCLLDFLEKALETIPITPIERNFTTVSSQDEDMGHFEMPDPLEESTTSLVSSSTSAYASFPVDVVVYVRVQPSQIKFSCLPVSRVECMLKLPSLDLVFSSNRGELEMLGAVHPAEAPSPGGTTAQSGARPCASKSGTPGSSGLGSPLGRSRHSSSQSDLSGASSSSSGLSFTACMSDFSLYVFHPYGAGKQKTAVSGLTAGSGGLGNVDEEPTSVTGRKDSLSINLEFVKVSLSRIRRSGGASFSDGQPSGKSAGKVDTTLINISAVCDIGSASFKYDMRRLSEILAFPRAWYRRSIARRLFLGDQTINLPTSGPGTPDSIEGISQHLSPESSRKAYCRAWEQPSQSASFSHTPQSPSVFGEHMASSTMSPGTAAQSLKSPVPTRSRSVSDSSVPRRDSLSKTSTPFNKSSKAASQQGAPWETLVVFAINLKQLNVQMNMSNVMGNTTWTTSGLKSQGRLSVGSNRDREISMSVGLGRSQLDSKGGVVGGTIDVNALEMVAHISEHPNQQPSHKIQITMGSTEARVDYMGSSILMGIFSNADLKLQDEWKVNLYNTLDSSMTDKSEIFVHGDLKWDIFQVMISRSTTPDLIKIGMKLQEFFTQQFDTSKRALSTWGPVPYLPPKMTTTNLERSSQEQLLDAAHHRHWPGVLKVVSGCHISLFQVPLPEDGMQFGGSMSLHGNHMTLACFHGPNFRSKSWALFHLEEPNIAFWTEAQKIWEDGSSDHSTYIVQTLDFHLGHNTMVTKPCGALESPMATITKITRRRHENPPHGVASVKEWFNYVTATRNEELNLLRNVDANNMENSTAVKNSSLLSGFRGGSSYNHETETIFALPRMQLDFKSIHVQEPQEPSLQDANQKPKVECSVVTEFTDHICVTMDAELIMFLHDLVSAYLKEKEKAIFPPRILSTRPGQKSPIILHDDSSSEKDREDGITYTTVDWRDFMCNTWHLEPTLRLISWTGRKIDPVGVDYILQKLGFHHARTTIPKWLQRGVMDPLDKVLSVLIKKLVRPAEAEGPGPAGPEPVALSSAVCSRRLGRSLPLKVPRSRRAPRGEHWSPAGRTAGRCSPTGSAAGSSGLRSPKPRGGGRGASQLQAAAPSRTPQRAPGSRLAPGVWRSGPPRDTGARTREPAASGAPAWPRGRRGEGEPG